MMRSKLNFALGGAALVVAMHASADVMLFENEGFSGRSFTASGAVDNFEHQGFNDRASSVVVRDGAWEFCSDADFHGRCVVLRAGSYSSLASMNLDKSVSSVRPAGADRGDRHSVAEPNAYVASDEYHRRSGERLYTVPVNSVHAVVGPPQQRCWVEREKVAGNSSSGLNVPGAIIGGVLGGILGHQVGGGRGQDVATGVGAVGGAAIGANVGRTSEPDYSQNVQRCETVASSGPPDYWDVSYSFQGFDHHVQMTAPPGPTILVNAQGEPRV
jgi:uncharacterized protein YcfJ